MKNLKKTIAAILTAAMAMSFAVIPSMAQDGETAGLMSEKTTQELGTDVQVDEEGPFVVLSEFGSDCGESYDGNIFNKVFEISNYTDNAVKITPIAAIYDADGSLMALETAEQKSIGSETVKREFDFKLSQEKFPDMKIPEGGKTKVFLWNSLDNMQPVDYRIPLSDFTACGMTIEWSRDNREKAYAYIGDYKIEFTNGDNTVVVDDGTFHLNDTSYIDNNGNTFVSPESIDLCNKLYKYHLAIIDAQTAEADELYPLKSIDTNQDKVLVCTWNKYPDSYKDGTEITLAYGDVWVFTADEVKEWGRKNGRDLDMTFRMEQLIGLPPQKGNTHFSLLWVDPKDMFRPSRDNEINDTEAELTFPEGTSQEYIDWFNSNAESSYNPHRYPWTGLGYTYDWADNGTDYGLSEFIVKSGSKATVEKTYTNNEFYDYITSDAA